MSSKGSSQRLQLECHHNPLLRALYISFIVVAGVCLLVTPLSWLVKGFSLLLLIALGVRTWFMRCELGGEQVVLLWDGEGCWWWRQGGQETELRLTGDSYIATWLIILNLHEPTAKRGYALLLFQLSMDTALYRRLTVRLKLEGGDEKAGPGGIIKP